MSKGSLGLPAFRKTVQCVNEECPEVASKGHPWKAQVKAVRVDTTVCPRCSSAVVAVAPTDDDGEGGGEVAVADLSPPTPEHQAALLGSPATLLLRRSHPFMGIPRHALGEVRVGMAARQYLLERSKRGESLEQVAARTLDELAAGTLDPRVA